MGVCVSLECIHFYLFLLVLSCYFTANVQKFPNWNFSLFLHLFIIRQTISLFLRHYACLYVCAWYLFGYQTKEEPSFSCVQTLLEAGRVLLVANVSDENERRDETNFVIRFFVFFRFLRSVFKFTQNCFAQRNPTRRVFLFCFILAKSRSGRVVVLFVQIVFLYIQNAI